MKYRSRSAGQGACLKCMPRTITLQGFRLAAVTDVEKTKLQRKNFQSQWTVKYRSRVLGQGACLKYMSRTITVQGYRLAAITDVEKNKLRCKHFQSPWTVKYRSRVLGQDACLMCMSRTITMQELLFIFFSFFFFPQKLIEFFLNQRNIEPENTHLILEHLVIMK